MLLGAVQTNPAFGEKPANRSEIESLITGVRADLWVLPELALSGYEFTSREEVRELAEEIPDGESTRWLHQLCREHECRAVMGIAERHDSGLYNASILVGPAGLIGRYRKLHLFDREFARFDPGNLPFQVFDIGIARVGMMICFDWIYPESARTLSLLGAQIIAHPANLVMRYCRRSMPTRAVENKVFCCTANRIGVETRDNRSIGFTGCSLIVSEHGDVLSSADADTTGCIVAEIDPARADDKNITNHNHLLDGRRPEFYTIEKSP